MSLQSSELSVWQSVSRILKITISARANCKRLSFILNNKTNQIQQLTRVFGFYQLL
ncbi:uncharacterized protein LOC105208613 [Zeugodacus cucurbitae]|uniref:uncharacterized protein LOC105208613 n=1 Tax=Zeugodacus cucurbitae TaxID=28588 RepID=UPI0023D9664C|nr:uncharacterized protein LOC105208613 [Zeugodacus cucurbitae]